MPKRLLVYLLMTNAQEVADMLDKKLRAKELSMDVTPLL